MRQLLRGRLRTLLVLAALTVAMGLVPQFAHSNPASAQTSTDTATATGTVMVTDTPAATGTATVSPTATATATVQPTAASTDTPTVAPATVSPTTSTTPTTVVFASGVPVFTICGTVSQYTAATSSATGTLTLAGVTFTIGSTAVVGGVALATGQAFCVQLQFTNGQVSAALVTSTTSTTQTLNVCGPVTVFTAATSAAAGQITIAGQLFNIATGVTFTGATPTVGSTYCFSGTFNTTGQLSVGVLSAPLAATAYRTFEGASGYRVGRAYND